MKQNSAWKKLVGVFVGVIYVAFGFLMMNSPKTTLASLSLFMGWTVTISGILVILDAIRFRNEPENPVSFIDGFLLLILGLMFLFGNFINNTLVLAYLLIFWIITDSALQLQFLVRVNGGWAKYLTMILDIIIIVYGVSLLFKPSSAENFLVFSVGIAFIATGITKATKVM